MEDNLATLYGGAEAVPPSYPQSGMQTAIQQKPLEDRAEATPLRDVVSVSIGLDDTGINTYEALRLDNIQDVEGYEPPEDLMDQMEARGIPQHNLDALLDVGSPEELEARMRLYEQRAKDEAWRQSMGGKGTVASFVATAADLPGLAMDAAATAVGGGGLLSRGKRMLAAAGAFGAAGAARGYLSSRIDQDYTPGKAFVDFAANAAFGAMFQGVGDWLHPAERIALANKLAAQADATNPATIARKAAEQQAALMPKARPLTAVDRRVREMAMRSEEAIRGGPRTPGINPPDPAAVPQAPSGAVPGASASANAREMAIQQERLIRNRITPEKAEEVLQAELGRLQAPTKAIKTEAELKKLRDQYSDIRWLMAEQKRNLADGGGELLDVELNKLVTERNDLIAALSERGKVDVLSDGVAPLSDSEVSWITGRLDELAKLVPARAEQLNTLMQAKQAEILQTMDAHSAGQAAGYQYREFMQRYMAAKKQGPTAVLELAESLNRKPYNKPGVDLDTLPKQDAPAASAVPDEAAMAAKRAEEEAEAAALKASEDFADAEVTAAATAAEAPIMAKAVERAAAKTKAAVSNAVEASRKYVDDAVAKAKKAFEDATDLKIAKIAEDANKKLEKATEGLKTAAASLAEPKIRLVNAELEKAIKAATAASKEQLKASYQKAVTEAEAIAAKAREAAKAEAKKAVDNGMSREDANKARTAANAKIEATLKAAKESAKKATVSKEAEAAIAELKKAAEAKIAEINAAASKAVSAKKSKTRDTLYEESAIAIGKAKASAAEKLVKELQKVKAAAKQEANTQLVKAKRTAELTQAEEVSAAQRASAERIAAAVEQARGTRAKAREATRATAAEVATAAKAQAKQTAQESAVVADDSAGAMRAQKVALDGADYDQNLSVGKEIAETLEELGIAGAEIETRTPAMRGLGYISGIVRGAKDHTVRALGRIFTGDSVMAVKNGREVLNEVALSDLAAINYNTIFVKYRRATEEAMRGYFTGFKGGLKRMFSARARQEFQARVTRATRGHLESDPFVLRAVQAAQTALAEALELQKRFGVQGAADIPSSNSYVPRVRQRDFVESIGQKVGYSYQGITETDKIVQELLKKAINNGFVRAGKGDRLDDAITEKVAKAISDRLFYQSKSPNLYEAPKFDLDHLDDLLSAAGVPESDRDLIAAFFSDKDPVGGADAKAANHLKHRVLMDETASIELDDGSILSISDLFEDDMEALVEGYVRHAAGLAAYAEKGYDNPKKLWAVIEDLHSKKRMTDAEFRAFEIMHKSFLGLPLESDPSGALARTFRTVGNFNFATMMGQVAWSMFAETGAIIAESGWRAAAKQIPAMAEVFQQAKSGKLDSVFARELASLHEPGASGLKNPISLRAQDYDIIGPAGAVEQGSRVAARGVAYVSGMTPLNDAQQIWNSRLFMQKMYDIAKTNDAIPEAWMNRLRQYGMDTEDVVALRAHLAAHGQDRNGVLTEVGLDVMSPALQRKLQVMMHRQTRRVVQEASIGDTMPWVHNSTARMLTQFRGFGLTAFAKRTLHSVYRHDATALTAFTYGLGFAALGLAGRTATTHPSDSKHYQNVFDNPGRFMALAFAATGEASILPMLWDTVAAGLNHDYTFGNAARSTGNATGVIEGIPTMATVNNLWTAVKLGPKLLQGGQMTSEDYKATIGFIFGQTTWGLAMAHRVLAGKFPSQWEVDRDERR